MESGRADPLRFVRRREASKEMDYAKTRDQQWNGVVPDSFDVPTTWPPCASVSGHFRDQSSCLAFGSTEAFIDRRCTATGDTIDVGSGHHGQLRILLVFLHGLQWGGQGRLGSDSGTLASSPEETTRTIDVTGTGLESIPCMDESFTSQVPQVLFGP